MNTFVDSLFVIVNAVSREPARIMAVAHLGKEKKMSPLEWWKAHSKWKVARWLYQIRHWKHHCWPVKMQEAFVIGQEDLE